jgi:hypothetical protein
MTALALCKELCPNKIPTIIEPYIASGADGEVYDSQNHKITKLCHMYDQFEEPLHIRYEKRSNIFS